jgi:hypothetical protein
MHDIRHNGPRAVEAPQPEILVVFQKGTCVLLAPGGRPLRVVAHRPKWNQAQPSYVPVPARGHVNRGDHVRRSTGDSAVRAGSPTARPEAPPLGSTDMSLDTPRAPGDSRLLGANRPRGAIHQQPSRSKTAARPHVGVVSTVSPPVPGFASSPSSSLGQSAIASRSAVPSAVLAALEDYCAHRPRERSAR